MPRNVRPLLGRLSPFVVLCAGPAAALARSLADASALPADNDSHSTLIPHRLLWPGVVVIVLIALFVTAAVAGPLIRANTREDHDDLDPK